MIRPTRLVTDLVSRQAFTSETSIALQEAVAEAAMQLEDLGLVLVRNGQVHLTEKGLKEVRPAAVLSQSTLIMRSLQGSEKPLADMGHCELLVALKEAGFHWRRFPRRGLRPFRVGGAKHYFSNGYTERALPRAYLHCLLHAHRGLEPNIAEVPHGLGARAYEAMLRGEEAPVVVRLRALDVEEDTLLQEPSADLPEAGREHMLLDVQGFVEDIDFVCVPECSVSRPTEELPKQLLLSR